MRRLLLFILMIACCAGCSSVTQMKMDAEVDRLCAIDGGLKIHETVTLPLNKFNKYNQINFVKFTQGENALGPDYIWKWKSEYLQPGGDPHANSRMWRSHMQIFRRSDGKLLGESIRYSRYGGDSRFLNEFYGGGPPESHHSCPEEGAGSNELFKGAFIK